MISNTYCPIKEGTKEQTNSQTRQFIRTVLEQDRRVKKLHQQEIQSTTENPRIRDQHDTKYISEELKALRHDEFVHQKRRQQLRVNNHELRQLELQIRAALNFKKLEEQMHVLDDNKKQKLLLKQKENAEFEKLRIQNLELELEEEKKERSKRSAFRSSLLDQMQELKQKRLNEYTEVLRDRESMQKMLQEFDIERENERKELEKRKKESHDMMQQFLQESAEYKKRMELQDRADDTTMLKLLEDRELERIRLQEERRQRQEINAALSNKIGQQLYETMEEKRKRENLLVDLLVEERNAKEDLRFRNELNKREEERLQMRSELDRYIREVKQLKSLQKQKEDENWLKESKKIVAEAEKLDKEEEEIRMKKKLEYKKSVLQLTEERRKLRILDAAEQRNLHKQLKEAELKNDAEVQDERLRLLKSCPPDILRFLPPGAIQESDREYLALPPIMKKVT